MYGHRRPQNVHKFHATYWLYTWTHAPKYIHIKEEKESRWVGVGGGLMVERGKEKEIAKKITL